MVCHRWLSFPLFVVLMRMTNSEKDSLLGQTVLPPESNDNHPKTRVFSRFLVYPSQVGYVNNITLFLSGTGSICTRHMGLSRAVFARCKGPLITRWSWDNVRRMPFVFRCFSTYFLKCYLMKICDNTLRVFQVLSGNKSRSWNQLVFFPRTLIR